MQALSSSTRSNGASKPKLRRQVISQRCLRASRLPRTLLWCKFLIIQLVARVLLQPGLTVLAPCVCACGALQLRGNWVELETPDGDVYFANIVTKETSWDMPVEAEEAGEKENAAPQKQERVTERCTLICARPILTTHA